MSGRTKAREEQELREMENRERRRNGQLTPWQEARRARSERRAADPAVQKRRVQSEKETDI
jgi:hypothetical protein